jgi:hypothetical protein
MNNLVDNNYKQINNKMEKNKTKINSEFVKRMIVGSDNLVDVQSRFFNGEFITDEEVDRVNTITPTHRLINWGENNRLTLLPWTALEHLHYAIKDTVERGVEGDFIETGVWAGGACILAKSIYNEVDPHRKVYAADSFRGLPKPDPKYPQDNGDRHYLDPMLSVSKEQVIENFNKFGLVDDNLIFVEGWFKDTMPNLNVEKLSIIRLDGDMYESTIQVLDALYNKLSIGGYLIIDDFHHNGCAAAIQDFRNKHGITNPIKKVDSNPLNEVHYWVK